MNDSLPLTIYHYCTSEALFNIIKSQKLRFSNIRLSEDYKEQIVIYNYLDKVVNSYSGESKRFLYEIQGNAGSDIETVYAASFSSEPDILSMWRGYSNECKGYCIGFNTKYFRPASDFYVDTIDPFAVYCEAILYNEKDVCTQIRDVFTEALKLNGTSQSQAAKEYAELQLKRLGSIVKANHFHEEKEYRLLMIPHSRFSKALMSKERYSNVINHLNFAHKSNKIISYYDYHLLKIGGEDSKRESIKEIILGERNNQDQGELRMLLQRYEFNYEDIEIKKSDINP